MIGRIDSYSNETINLLKTKVVARNRGVAKNDENKIVNEKSMEICIEYIYLGIFLNTMVILGWKKYTEYMLKSSL